MERSDVEIKQLVEQELLWDTKLNSAQVGVTVKHGIVTLVGTLSSWGERMAAQRAAHRVAGVLDVANDLTVKAAGSSMRNDTDIAEAVRHALDWDVFVPKDKITTTVNEGWVTLEGTVEHWNERVAAEKAIRNLAGVVNVVNKMEVKPGVYTGDIRRAIEDALERRAQRQASHIEIGVEEGKVTLSGIVGSASEREAIVGASLATAGVSDVVDRLRVELRAV
jgi:hyperosmotically inducible protein